jgi:hypothetical protein
LVEEAQISADILTEANSSIERACNGQQPAPACRRITKQTPN